MIFALVGVAGITSAGTRSPVVAGTFYSNNADELRSDVRAMLEQARSSGDGAASRALVVPHAGYVYSGPTAARAFATLPAKGVERVILLGPSHHVAFAGGALPAVGVTAFTTPLGDVALDLEAVAELRQQPGFSGPARAHDSEHSLEIELPFLQAAAPGALLVPIVVGGNTGTATAREMARALSRLVDDRTVVIASSDFTHHGRGYRWAPFQGAELGETLLEIGRLTAGRVAAMDSRGFVHQVEVSGDTVCGVRPVEILTELLEHSFDGSGRVLGITTSGHLTGSFDLSVTYASIAFSGAWRPWSDEPVSAAAELAATDGRALVDLARATLRTKLAHDASLAKWFSAHGDGSRLLMPAGSFVTLNNTGRRARENGRLRACMGVMEAEQPLVDAVVQAAVLAARDPRFPQLELAELAKLEVEVSVLSPLREVASFDDIEVGKHGVVLTRDGRRAVFLPQVAVEQGWDRDTMLEHLSAKAGLPRNAWQRGATFEVFTAQVFSEHE